MLSVLALSCPEWMLCWLAAEQAESPCRVVWACCAYFWGNGETVLSCICFWLGQLSMEQVLFIWQASMEQLTLLVSFVFFVFFSTSHICAASEVLVCLLFFFLFLLRLFLFHIQLLTVHVIDLIFYDLTKYSNKNWLSYRYGEGVSVCTQFLQC